jgi:hypothetical protein
MKNKKGNELSGVFWIILIIICLVLAIFVGFLFVEFGKQKDIVIDKEESGGNIILNYTNNITGLYITKAIPTNDAIGIKLNNEGQYFDFAIDTKLDNATSIDYEISVIKDVKKSTIPDSDIRIYLEKENSGTYTKVFGPSEFKGIKEDSKLGSQAGSMILNKVTTKKSIVDNYRLRLWLSDSSNLQNGDYAVEVVVNGKAN